MLTDNRAQYRPQEWFLIACDGDLVLKLAHDLRIGEDENGQTLLSPAREEALLAITCGDGRLTLKALAMNWTFSEEGGLSVQHLTFVQGLSLKLSFPNSSLIITPDFVAGNRVSIDREIELKPTSTPSLTLTRVDEPIVLVEPELPLPTASNDDCGQATTRLFAEGDAEELNMDEVTALLEAANETSEDPAFLNWHHDVPDEIPPQAAVDADDIPLLTMEVAREIPVLTTPLQAPVNPTRREHASARQGMLSGLLAATLLLAPMVLFLGDAAELGVAFSLTNYRSTASPAIGSEWPEDMQPVAGQRASRQLAAADQPALSPSLSVAQDRPAADAVAVAEAEAAVTATVSPPRLTEEQQLLIASLLAEAKAYYDSGAIVTPVDANAVSNLSRILHLDPGNEAGLKLMYQSAVRLIEEAQAAHDAGNNYLARNLVEDVLGFHPEFQDARALLDRWTHAPES